MGEQKAKADLKRPKYIHKAFLLALESKKRVSDQAVICTPHGISNWNVPVAFNAPTIRTAGSAGVNDWLWLPLHSA